MSTEMMPTLMGVLIFAWAGGILFIALGIYLSIRKRRLHPVLLLSISALSFSWIEAPYDWTMYAQFTPAWPRMPSWWPLNMTWGGLPASVPLGYIPYFVLPAVIGAPLGQWLSAKFQWRRPITLLSVGLVVGVCWALFFNAIIGSRLDTFHYGYVIPGLALWEKTIYQYPLYDSLAMGVQMMVFTYLLGRTDDQGRNLIEIWAAKFSQSRARQAVLSIVAVVVVGHAAYGAVFAPHLATKLGGWVNSGPTEQLFPGVPNQPLGH
jgi:uncharacterized protein DUF5135